MRSNDATLGLPADILDDGDAGGRILMLEMPSPGMAPIAAAEPEWGGMRMELVGEAT